jgi:hypothetical protein
MSMSDNNFVLCKSSFSYIRDLGRIRSYLDHDTAVIIASSPIHSRLD